MQATAGVYYWAGPGTIRMIRVKFFQPRIDEQGLLRSYDPDVLSALKATLNPSDAWVTYSWGFSQKTEEEDRAFLRRKLPNFHRLGIRAHAYVQGTNLVEAEHRDIDVYCRDHRGQKIPYHRGRKLCCPQNPRFRALLLDRVERACREEVDGVFIDNLHFGQFPVPVGEHLTSFGCHCLYCQAGFRAFADMDIPTVHRLGDERTTAYLLFRSNVLHAFVEELRSVTRTHGKFLGSNGLDATLNPVLYYGYDPLRLAQQQDYLLFENFNHPLGRRNNESLQPIIRAAQVPVFVVSYKRVIGKHPACTQRDIDGVHAESQKLGYVPCYKASEFTTDGLWHNIRPEDVRRPSTIALPKRRESLLRKRPPMPLASRVRDAVNRIDLPLLERIYEQRRYRFLFGWLIDTMMMRSFSFTSVAVRVVRSPLRMARRYLR